MKPRLLVIVGLSCLLVAGPGYARTKRSAKKPAKQEQPAAQPVPVAPPPTLAEMPASPPQVSFQGGQLTISAQNSTLGDILKAVRTQTNATIDVPGSAPERVVGHFGPGPARDVLTSLLNGTHFNYLLLGSSTDPNALDRVILIAKSGAIAGNNPPPTQEDASNQNYNRPMAMPMAAPGANTTVVEGQDAQDDTADDSADSADSGDDAQADDSADQADQGDEQAGDEQQAQPDGQPAVKTPEQLLQELQQRQQQIQQQGVQPGVPGFPTPGAPGLPGPPHN